MKSAADEAAADIIDGKIEVHDYMSRLQVPDASSDAGAEPRPAARRLGDASRA